MSTLVSVDGPRQELGEEPTVGGRKFLIKPLKSLSMEVLRPVPIGVKLCSLGGVPTVVKEGLEDWLGGRV
jgi:hypothetical protein